MQRYSNCIRRKLHLFRGCAACPIRGQFLELSVCRVHGGRGRIWDLARFANQVAESRKRRGAALFLSGRASKRSIRQEFPQFVESLPNTDAVCASRDSIADRRTGHQRGRRESLPIAASYPNAVR